MRVLSSMLVQLLEYILMASLTAGAVAVGAGDVAVGGEVGVAASPPQGRKQGYAHYSY